MNRQQLETLRGDVGKWQPVASAVASQDYPAVAAAYNERPQTPNPEAQADVPRRLSWREALRAMTEAERLAVYERSALKQDLQAGLAANDRQALGDLVPVMRALLSSGTLVKLGALLQETEPDPAWTATVAGESRATSLGLGRVRAADVQAALHLG